LTPKGAGFFVEVPALQYHTCQIPLPVTFHRFSEIAFIAKIENPFYDEFPVLLVIDFGSVPEEGFCERRNSHLMSITY
jgi:hypothetical protein